MKDRELRIIIADLQLRVGCLEERIDYLEHKCSLGGAFHLTASTSTGAPMYTELRELGDPPKLTEELP